MMINTLRNDINNGEVVLCSASKTLLCPSDLKYNQPLPLRAPADSSIIPWPRPGPGNITRKYFQLGGSDNHRRREEGVSLDTQQNFRKRNASTPLEIVKNVKTLLG